MTSLLLTLLKLDFFFVFSFAAQLIPSQDLGYDDSITETVLVFVFGGIGLSLALVAVYRENKYAMLAFIFGGVLAVAYFVYRIVVIARPRTGGYDPYLHTRQFLIFTTVIATVLIVLTIGVACKCFWNVHKNILIFKDKSMHGKKIYGNEQIAIDHDSMEDFEMTSEANAANPSKTLLEMNNERVQSARTKSQQQDDKMWSIE